jgi:hypothetical protein
VIITLGEVLIGTVASIGALVNGEAGWSADAVLLSVAGVGLALGVWWMYFAVPWAEPLARHRERIYTFSYLHLAVFGCIAAMGAGLHVAAYVLEDKAEIGTTGVVLSVAIPVALLVGLFYALYSTLMRTFDPLHLALLAGTAACLALAVVLAASGVSVVICLLVISLAPAVTVVGYETLGHRHMTAALERL